MVDLAKTHRGAALGRIWLFAKPAVYLLVYWAALSFGLRSATDVDGKPFILWLASGVLPWFFMLDAIHTGSNVYRRYPYLVNRIKFPLSVISLFYMLSLLLVLTVSLGIVALVCLPFGILPTRYLLQLPLVLVLMYLFWSAWSIALSPLSAISKDFANLVKTLSTPLFWLSGILYQVEGLPRIGRVIMAFNPVSWCVEAVRDCFVYGRWIWDEPGSLAAFLFMLVLMVVLARASYGRLSKEVPDVI